MAAILSRSQCVKQVCERWPGTVIQYTPSKPPVTSITVLALRVSITAMWQMQYLPSWRFIRVKFPTAISNEISYVLSCEFIVRWYFIWNFIWNFTWNFILNHSLNVMSKISWVISCELSREIFVWHFIRNFLWNFIWIFLRNFIHRIKWIISYEISSELSYEISHWILLHDEVLQNFNGNFIGNDRGKFHMNESSSHVNIMHTFPDTSVNIHLVLT